MLRRQLATTQREIGPRASLRYETITFDWTRETGGPMALTIDRDQYKALEGRAGVSVSGKQGMKIRPYFEANYVHEFLDQVTSFGAAFVGTNSIAPFALAGTDNDWGEISGGLSISLGSRAELAVEADSTIFRDDLRNQSYRGRITIHF